MSPRKKQTGSKVAATRLPLHEYALLEALADARGTSKARTLRDLVVKASREKLLQLSSEPAR